MDPQTVDIKDGPHKVYVVIFYEVMSGFTRLKCDFLVSSTRPL